MHHKIDCCAHCLSLLQDESCDAATTFVLFCGPGPADWTNLMSCSLDVCHQYAATMGQHLGLDVSLQVPTGFQACQQGVSLRLIQENASKACHSHM